MTRNRGRVVAARLTGCAWTGLVLFALAGCYEERVVWSPDGQRAFVRGDGGDLRMCAADGALSNVLLTNVRTAAWLGDGEGMVVVRKRAEGNDEVAVARLQDGGRKLEVAGAVFSSNAKDEIVHVRVAPGGRTAAIVVDVDDREEESFALHVAALDGGSPAVLIADETSAFPDWTHDGRAIIYWAAGGNLANKDDLRLGTLTRREITPGEQGLVVSNEKQSLAAGLFSPFTRVRCLSDGRVLFNATEVELPLTVADVEGSRDQLFVLDPMRQATLTRLVPRGAESDLPEALAFFEPSPDGTRIVFGDTDGRVAVLTLATGEAEVVQEPGGKSLQGAPVWRLTGELCYFRRTRRTDDATDERAGEFVLRGSDGETVLSASWPTDVLNDVVE